MDQRQFDDIIRKKALESKETFDMEKMWANVEPLILKKEPQKKRFLPLFFVGLGAISLILVLLFIFMNDNLKEKLETGKNTNESVVQMATNGHDQGTKSVSQSNDDEVLQHTKILDQITPRNALSSGSQKPVDRKYSQKEVLEINIAKNFENHIVDKSIGAEDSLVSQISIITESDVKEFAGNSESIFIFESVKLLEDTLNDPKDHKLENLRNVDAVNRISILKITPETLNPITPKVPDLINVMVPHLCGDYINKSWLSIGTGYYANLRQFNSSGLHNQADFNRRNNTETPLDATAFNFNYRREFRKGFSWSTGLNFTSTWDTREDTFVADTVENVGAQNYVINRSVRRYLNYSTIGVPAYLHYETNFDKFSILIGLGVETSIVNLRKGYIWFEGKEYDIKEDNKNIFKNRFNMKAVGSIGINYLLNTNMALQFNIQGQMPLTNMYDNTYEVNDRHFLIGGQLGLQYKL